MKWKYKIGPTWLQRTKNIKIVLFKLMWRLLWSLIADSYQWRMFCFLLFERILRFNVMHHFIKHYLLFRRKTVVAFWSTDGWETSRI
jgi:hypothetical protein